MPAIARASSSASPSTTSSGSPLSSAAGLARREHDRDRLRQQPASDERERQRRRLVQPLRVVDHAEQRALLGRLREQAERRQTDQEAVRRFARHSARTPRAGHLCCGPGRRSSRSRRGAHSCCSAANGSSISDSTPTARMSRRSAAGPDRVLQQRSLAHARFAAEHERAALTGAHRVEQLIQYRALRVAPPQGGLRVARLSGWSAWPLAQHQS